ncbi:hypothetical protein V5097_13790 [Arenibacter palladensis]|uniref:hypothetical protein n=1 Tax=Arenibacter palladensis TaxID=237373 RepID=UPI002FD52378
MILRPLNPNLPLSAANRTSTIYLPHEDKDRDTYQGKILTAVNNVVATKSGVEHLTPLPTKKIIIV